MLPLLNGLAHFELLDTRFGADRVLRGLCSIAARLDADGSIEHLSSMHALRFGEADGSMSARAIAFRDTCIAAGFGADLVAGSAAPFSKAAEERLLELLRTGTLCPDLKPRLPGTGHHPAIARPDDNITCTHLGSDFFCGKTGRHVVGFRQLCGGRFRLLGQIFTEGVQGGSSQVQARY